MKRLALFGALVTLAGVSLGVYFGNKALDVFSAQVNNPPPYISPAVLDLQETVAATANRITPSVAHLTTKKIVRDIFFRSEREVVSGYGSGIVISEDGYIVTNKHVVQTADKVNVALANGMEGVAKVIGTDRFTDIAVLKLEGFKDLTYARFGDSDNVRIGDFVLAIGSPLGYHHSVTFGIVSAKGRIIDPNQLQDLIQTDAALNPGNSGGALVNLKGEVVGMNTAIVISGGRSPGGTPTNTGVGLAYTSNIVQRVAGDIIKYGRFRRGYLGVITSEIDSTLAAEVGLTLEALTKELGIENADGVLVRSVQPDSPAQETGLKPGDLILAVKNNAIKSNSDLRLLLSLEQPGSSVELTILRNKRKLTKKVEVTEFPR